MRRSRFAAVVWVAVWWAMPVQRATAGVDNADKVRLVVAVDFSRSASSLGFSLPSLARQLLTEPGLADYLQSLEVLAFANCAESYFSFPQQEGFDDFERKATEREKPLR